MDGAGVQGLVPVADAKESSRLLERFGAKPGHFEEVTPRLKSAVGIPVILDRLGQAGAQSGNVAQELAAGRIDLNTHPVHATYNHVVQLALEETLVDVVLVLSHADGSGVNLDQFGQRVHQAPPDGYRSPDGDIHVGKFFPGGRGSGVDRSPAFADHYDLDSGTQTQAPQKRFRFPASGSVAHGDDLGVVPLAQA